MACPVLPQIRCTALLIAGSCLLFTVLQPTSSRSACPMISSACPLAYVSALSKLRAQVWGGRWRSRFGFDDEVGDRSCCQEGPALAIGQLKPDWAAL